MDFIGKIAINKGWSDDKKYCVTDQNNQKYLLRVSDKEKLDSKKIEFDMMEKVASLGNEGFEQFCKANALQELLFLGH